MLIKISMLLKIGLSLIYYARVTILFYRIKKPRRLRRRGLVYSARCNDLIARILYVRQRRFAGSEQVFEDASFRDLFVVAPPLLGSIQSFV